MHANVWFPTLSATSSALASHSLVLILDKVWTGRRTGGTREAAFGSGEHDKNKSTFSDPTELPDLERN